MMKAGRIALEGGTELIDSVHISELYDLKVHVKKIEGRFIAWS
jgi:ABC-type enterochelin transport system ATPase subunit